MLNENGLMIIDNVLWKGAVSNSDNNEKKLNNLYDLLVSHSGQQSVILHLQTSKKRIQKLVLNKYPIQIIYLEPTILFFKEITYKKRYEFI